MKHTNTVRVKSSLAAIAFIVAAAVPVAHGTPIKYSASGDYTGLPEISIRGACYYYDSSLSRYKDFYFLLDMKNISIKNKTMFFTLSEGSVGYDSVTYTSEEKLAPAVKYWLSNGETWFPVSEIESQLKAMASAATAMKEKSVPVIPFSDYSRPFTIAAPITPGTYVININVDAADINDDPRCMYTSKKIVPVK